MKRVCLTLVLEEFERDFSHENVGAKFNNEPQPVSNTRPIGALKRLLNANRDRLPLLQRRRILSNNAGFEIAEGRGVLSVEPTEVTARAGPKWQMKR